MATTDGGTILVRFGDGHEGAHGLYGRTPEQLVAALTAQAASATAEDLAAVGCTRRDLTPVSWRRPGSFAAGAAFLRKYAAPGHEAGVERMIERIQGGR